MLRARLSEALKTAMRDRDQPAVSTVRLILAALKDRDIAARTKGNTEGIGDPEILQLLQSMVKQRRESIELYARGGRQDLVDQETGEIAVIERFMPQQMDEAAMAAAIAAGIADAGAGGIKDMGRVMTLLRERHAGQMDFARASQLVKQALG
ncbi:GatB/YqeY domain-containing protein [Stella sp.]|uniref:GatB/YqeY domain-containing protein n=1 Tax=Stella sp. TaxID=2912054 RepID=UPI0035AE9818